MRSFVKSFQTAEDPERDKTDFTRVAGESPKASQLDTELDPLDPGLLRMLTSTLA